MDYKFRTKAACRIADVDPQRLNEAIAAGSYPCAPTTSAGKSRIFDEADLIALFIWGYLVRKDYPLKIAAMYACNIQENMRQSNDGATERLDFPLDPFPNLCLAQNSGNETAFYNCGMVSYATMSFNLKDIRKEVQGRMKNEASILGEED